MAHRLRCNRILLRLSLIAVGAVLVALPGDPVRALRAADAPPAVAAPAGDEAATLRFDKDLRPLLAKYCLDCHRSPKPKADLDLDRFADEASVLKDRRTWKKVADALHSREMPPEDKPQPTAAERDRLTNWIEQMLARPGDDGVLEPGPPVVRRLTGVEYNNTLYDLFGFNKNRTYFDPAKGMPEVIRLVLHRNQRPQIIDLPPDDNDHGFSNISQTLSLPPFLMEKYIAAARQVTDLAAGGDTRERGGLQRSRVFNRRAGEPANRDTARAVLADLATRAFRRPLQAGEVDRYVALFDVATAKGENFDNALKAPIQAILVSPHFLFRVETGDPSREDKGVRPLTDHELASRLSYFIWSSMPDAELTSSANAGKLRDPAELERQARRMLRSHKAKEMAENFGIQWMQLDGIGGVTPDPDLFPRFFKLKYGSESMRQEALLLFEAVMIEDRSVLDLIDPGFTFLNGPLAQYYEYPAPEANQQNASLYWRRYEMTDKRRGGVLGLAGVLTATSKATRTSPVNRGKWILEALLGAPPPPPPPNVPDLEKAGPADESMKLRQKLELHRADPNCSSCHARMDPLGLGLENFDAVGLWRDREGKDAIDASATLSNGQSFNGVIELKQMLVTERKGDFVRCLSEHLLTYALGRKLEYYDAAAIRTIGQAAEQNDYRFSTLVVEVVKSYPFRHIRVNEVQDGQP